jgi:tetratricopeptide (TPR) repeat protein
MNDESKINQELLTNNTVGRDLKVEKIEQTTIIHQAASPPKYIPTYSIPYPASPNFVGSDGGLERLVGLHASWRIVAVVGMAGVGKTELAVQYAHKYGRSYGGGCYWLGMRDRVLADMLTQHVLREFGLDLPPEITDKRSIAQWCWAQWERNLSNHSQVLLVLDNVDEAIQIGGMLPSDGRFRLLVTTRCQGLDATIVEQYLEELTDAAALDFLRKLIGDVRIDRELVQAKRLCHDLLGNLPLGIELVGRYLHQDDEVTIAEFTADLSKVQEELDGKDPVAVYPTMNAQRGVKSALELSWQKLAPETQTVGKLLGLCAPKAIPWGLATKMAESALVAEAKLKTTPNPTSVLRQLGKNLGNLWKRKPKVAPTAPPARKILTVKQSRQQLEKLSLIKWDKERQTATLHALVRNFFQDRGQNSDILTQIFAETMLQRARQASQDMTLEQLAKMRDIVPHIEEVALHYSHLLSEDDFDWPFIGAAVFYDSQGLYAAAEPWYAKCLATAEQRLGANHPATAASLNNLAELYSSIGKYAAALPLSERALQICEQQLGANHPATATSLNNLAYFYNSIGKYAAAEPLYVRALQIREQQLGVDHPATAASLNNLAGLYDSIGKYTAALPLYVRALQIREQQLGANHPATAASLNNLAYLYSSIGKYAAAEPLYVRALQIREEQLGVDHPATATSLNNLAGLYDSIGKYAAALPLYVRALQIREQQLGVDHPSNATSLNNLAELYSSIGNYVAAEPLYVRALQICEQQLGANHLSTATSLNNLAGLYRSLDRSEEALPLYARAVEICDRVLGLEHPTTVTIRENYERCLRSQTDDR